MTLEVFLQIDLPAILTALLIGYSCAITGSLLVLQRQVMMGDALSHVVLPGIVVGFLIAGTLSSLPIFLGALTACLIATAIISTLNRITTIEHGAIMGIVFSSMFALGIVLLEMKVGTKVHLDVKHALYGALELTYWPHIETFSDMFSKNGLAAMPDQLKSLGFVFICTFIFALVMFKELRLVLFDPLYAKNSGLQVFAINTAILFFVAVTAVAAFEAVGSILVLALFVCPAATARMITDKLSTQIWMSCAFSSLAVIIGYSLAIALPELWKHQSSLNAAAMIAVTAGIIQIVAMLLAPHYGVMSKLGRRKEILFACNKNLTV